MAIKAGDIVWNIKGDSADLEKALDKSKRSIGKMGKAMAVGGAAVTGALSASVVAAGKFSSSMSEVATLGVKDLDGLGDSLKEISMAYGTDLTDAVNGAYQAISAGASEVEAPRLLESAAKAAAAGVSDMSTAVELGTSVANAFGMELSEVDKVFDQAFTAVKGGVTTFEELSASVGKLSPIMSAAGVETGEMFAGIAALTKGGIATSEAVTGLKAAMSGIIKPTAEAAKVAESLGLEFNVSALQSKGLVGFLDSVKQATGGNLETMSQLFTSTEALNAVLALTGEQAASFASLSEDMGNSVGATDEAFRSFSENNPALEFEKLKASITVLATEVGENLLPAIENIVDVMTPVVQSISGWMKANPELSSGLVIVTAALGSLALVLGPILSIIANASIAFGGAGIAATGAGVSIGAVGTAATAAAVPIGAAVAVLGVLGFTIGQTVASTFELVGAKRQLAKTEVALSAQVERAIKQLERNGGTIDRVALANMGLDEQIQAVHKALSENTKETGRSTESLKKVKGETDNLTKNLSDLAGTQSDVGGETQTTVRQQYLQRGESRASAEMAQVLYGRLRRAGQGYSILAIQAQRAAAAMANARAAGGGGMATGGVVEGFASGGVTNHRIVEVGERGRELVALPVGSRVMSHPDMMRAAGSMPSGSGNIGVSTAASSGVSPVFNINVTGAGMDTDDLVDKLKGPFSQWMADEYGRSRR